MASQVILVGANPIVRLFEGEKVAAFASIWVVDWSIEGAGTAVVLWRDGRVRVLSPTLKLANWLAQDFTRHFPEAEGLDWPKAEVERVPVSVRIDLHSGLSVTAGDVHIEGRDVLDHRQFTTDSFALDGVAHGLSLVLAPLGEADIAVDGVRLPGQVKREGSPERPGSSAFMTSAEVWSREALAA